MKLNFKNIDRTFWGLFIILILVAILAAINLKVGDTRD